MEDKGDSTLKSFLSSVSVKALNFSSRMILSNNLDCIQQFQSNMRHSRDYRGLAEQIGLPYQDIKVLEQFKNPTMKILEEWEINPSATLDKLIIYLEAMDRYDVIDDILPSLKKNVEDYIKYQNSQRASLEDVEEYQTYDVYVSYAEDDYIIAVKFIQKLESAKVRLKLFIRGRDAFVGSSEMDTAAEIEFIKNRCRHVLILLTHNFKKSNECRFLARFIDSLTVEQKQGALRPVLWQHCKIPTKLRNVPLIDFRKNDMEVWRDLMFEKLINSLIPKSVITMFSCCSNCNSNLTTENTAVDTSHNVSKDSGVYCTNK